LTIKDIEVGTQEIRLHLGDAPVQLPEPIAAPARMVAANRKGHATDVAVAWQRLSGGDWATYANEVSRRTATENR
jgi:hypothetical protein